MTDPRNSLYLRAHSLLRAHPGLSVTNAFRMADAESGGGESGGGESAARYAPASPLSDADYAALVDRLARRLIALDPAAYATMEQGRIGAKELICEGDWKKLDAPPDVDTQTSIQSATMSRTARVDRLFSAHNAAQALALADHSTRAAHLADQLIAADRSLSYSAALVKASRVLRAGESR